MFTHFFIAFFFSFIGSIPPGSINLSVMQLSLNGNIMAALRFALAAALVEYPYAYIALKFENLITSSQYIERNFALIGSGVMILLGLASWWSHRKPAKRPVPFMESGFRRGLIISLLNPLAIPFWVGITAYLKFQGWVEFSNEADYHFYVLGVSIGTFSLLGVVTIVAGKLGEKFADSKWIRFLPALAFLVLGLYGLLSQLL